MRASRETELLAKYPIKDVCGWIGNSQAVAMKHYAMARDAIFAEAPDSDRSRWFYGWFYLWPTGVQNGQSGQDSHRTTDRTTWFYQ